MVLQILPGKVGNYEIEGEGKGGWGRGKKRHSSSSHYLWGLTVFIV